MKTIGLYGWSGSGKTDLTCRLIKYFVKKNIVVSTFKHTHHNVEIDKKGKDSYLHRESGAREVMLGGKNNWALIHRGIKNEIFEFNELIKKFSKENDLLIIEGYKKLDIPKIELYHSKINKPLISNKNSKTIAIVYDVIDEKIENSDLPTFDFKNTKDIGKFIFKYLKLDEK
tara:strand:+ start:680 stop:1195 length:516 start_codon:yes stop_codon:yes gene_type:complete